MSAAGSPVRRYRALATDYDGTIAFEGAVDEPTVEALKRARDAGLRLLLVTGRELADLSNTFAHAALFDRIVAENGAVLLDPASGTLRPLAAAPPPGLVAALTRAHIPLSVGHSIVATIEPYDREVREAIRDQRLDWRITMNKGSVMALPAGVDKASGLAAALADLGLSADDTIAVGDAENDRVFLAACGMAAAVANALPDIREMAEVVTTAERGAGVAELIARLLNGEFDALPAGRRGRARDQ
jgi:hydroxymethylpyrimidine pyrophosphatase-like HAD family hydrolase